MPETPSTPDKEESSSPQPKKSLPSPSHFVEESTDPFLALFPHRYDYIYAPLAAPGDRPNWQTETSHPLSDRLIQQGAMFYGVSFGKTTRYALLDIDRHSPFHPGQDAFAVGRILAALEPLGITRCLRFQSSYSGGIHLYLPFEEEQKCGALALAIQTLLERDGFKLTPGHLEVFPDPKPYIPNAGARRYAAHRLPGQQGSYLLNDEWHPCYFSKDSIVRQWQFCTEGNAVTDEAVQLVLKTYLRRQYRLSAKATKFLNDLNTEVEQGWTSHGQTNYLLGRIAMREYIFGQLLYGEGPLEGIDLVQRIVKTAIALPGYRDWCRHQHEVHQRAEEWARSVEGSRYFHYGARSSSLSTLASQQCRGDDHGEATPLSWNERQRLEAREKIRMAIAQLLNANTLPPTAVARILVLRTAGISNSTLYKHKDLWHPEHLMLAELAQEEQISESGESVALESGVVENKKVENEKSAKNDLNSAGVESLGDSTRTAISLLATDGCNSPQDNMSSDFEAENPKSGCNVAQTPVSMLESFQPIAHQEAWESRQRIKQERIMQRHIDRMQRWLDSGDPILMAEAIAWARINPGVLKPGPTAPQSPSLPPVSE